jgi:Mg-chelatase subunit ChlD
VKPRSSLLGKNLKPAEIPLWVEIEHPAEGDIVGNPAGAFVAGRALAPRGQYRRLDVIVVVDTSGSTREPTGVDVNGNGVVGERHLGTLGSLFDLSSTDSGDSILAAEVAAARRLVLSLDPRATRVGLVTFAGEVESNGFFRRQRNPVITEVPLTTDYEQIERALDRVLERGPKGSTNMAAGVNQATIELIGAKGALSEPHPQAEKAVLFFTDGRPTLPYGPGHEAENVKEVLRAAELAERAEVRFFTFGIGEEALAGPIAVVELAGRTNGYFTPVRHPGNLLDVIEEVDFANVEELAVRNKTTGEQSNMVFKSPDGGFSALLTLEPGRNAIEVWARSSDGTEASDTVTVSYAPGAAEVPLPRPLAAQYNRLLERRLIELRRGRVEVEREHAEQTRKELELEIERERELAEERAEEQRKELDLSAEDKGPSS